jgi:hypothetical protein
VEEGDGHEHVELVGRRSVHGSEGHLYGCSHANGSAEGR